MVALTVFLSLSLAQEVKPSNPHRFPKIGLIPYNNTDIFPLEVGQKPFSNNDAAFTAVAPQLLGQTAARFPKGSAPTLATTADIQLIIGIFRSGGGDDAGGGFTKPPEDAKLILQNAASLPNFPPIDAYVIPFKRNNSKTGAPVPLTGTYLVLGCLPKDFNPTVTK